MIWDGFKVEKASDQHNYGILQHFFTTENVII